MGMEILSCLLLFAYCDTLFPHGPSRMPGDLSGRLGYRPLGDRPRRDDHGRGGARAEANPRTALRDGGSRRSGHGRTGHVRAAQGVAQEGDGVDGASGRRESQGDRDEGEGAGGVIGPGVDRLTERTSPLPVCPCLSGAGTLVVGRQDRNPFGTCTNFRILVLVSAINETRLFVDCLEFGHWGLRANGVLSAACGRRMMVDCQGAYSLGAIGGSASWRSTLVL